MASYIVHVRPLYVRVRIPVYDCTHDVRVVKTESIRENARIEDYSLTSVSYDVVLVQDVIWLNRNLVTHEQSIAVVADLKRSLTLHYLFLQGQVQLKFRSHDPTKQRGEVTCD